MKDRQTALIAEMKATKTSHDEALKLAPTTNIAEPVLVQLNIEIKEPQRVDIRGHEEDDCVIKYGHNLDAAREQDDGVASEKDPSTPHVTMAEEDMLTEETEEEQEDPVTPRQSKVFESPLEGAPQKHFSEQQDVGIVSPEALSQILDSLIESKQSQKEVQGDALYHEAIEMLQGELSRLSLEMANDNDIAAKLRGELGDLKTAQLSAKTTAELLESYNAMSMKLAAHKSVAAQRENVFARHEQQLLNEISDLRMEIRRLKGKSALKSMKKAFSSTVRGIKKSLDNTPKSVNSVSPLADTLPSLETYSPSPQGGGR
jgi:hypothetical protein